MLASSCLSYTDCKNLTKLSDSDNLNRDLHRVTASVPIEYIMNYYIFRLLYVVLWSLYICHITSWLESHVIGTAFLVTLVSFFTNFFNIYDIWELVKLRHDSFKHTEIEYLPLTSHFISMIFSLNSGNSNYSSNKSNIYKFFIGPDQDAQIY